MPKSYGYVDPKKAKDDPLVSQHIKVPQSVIDIVTIRAQKESRHNVWIYRDWITRMAEAYQEELRLEQQAAKKQQAKKKVAG